MTADLLPLDADLVRHATVAGPDLADMFSRDLVGAIETTWRSIQRHEPVVADVVVTIGPGRDGKVSKHGHFAEKRWLVGPDARNELFVAGESLKIGADHVLMTLLHEATHALAAARGVNDTSRNGRYHNTKFRDLAEGLGLIVLNTKDGEKIREGWTGDHVLTAAARARYRAEVEQLDAALRGYRIAEQQATAKTKTNNGVAAVCECEEQRKIRVHVSAYLAGPIVCGLCGLPFVGDLPDRGDEAEQDGLFDDEGDPVESPSATAIANGMLVGKLLAVAQAGDAVLRSAPALLSSVLESGAYREYVDTDGTVVTYASPEEFLSQQAPGGASDLLTLLHYLTLRHRQA